MITLQDKSLAQCMKPKYFGSITNCTLHYFSGTSQSGYGQCSYIRFVNDRAQTHCCLLMGKSRVTPLNFSHYFSGLSQSGYGQCSYIRFVNDRAQTQCFLLIGKSRVISLKFILILRLELTVAALSV